MLFRVFHRRVPRRVPTATPPLRIHKCFDPITSNFHTHPPKSDTQTKSTVVHSFTVQCLSTGILKITNNDTNENCELNTNKKNEYNIAAILRVQNSTELFRILSKYSK